MADIHDKELKRIVYYQKSSDSILISFLIWQVLFYNLIRKVILTNATFMNYYCDSNEYRYEISVPANSLSHVEDKMVLDTYNHIRRILNLTEQKEI